MEKRKGSRDRKMEYRFGAALARVLNEYGIRQDLLAKKVGMTPSNLSNVKNQKDGIGFEKAMAIIEALPEKAKTDMCAELFELPEVWFSSTGEYRKAGTKTRHSDLGKLVKNLKTGQAMVLRKMPPLTPSRLKEKKSSE